MPTGMNLVWQLGEPVPMSACRNLFLCCSLLALVACQDTGIDSAECDGVRCDTPAQSVDIMPRAPSTPGTVSITRNQDQWLFEVIGAKGDIEATKVN